MVVVISLDGFAASTLDDSKAPIPTLRNPISSGVSARMYDHREPYGYLAQSHRYGDRCRADGHGLLANGTTSPPGAWPPVKVEPMIEKEKMVHVWTVYDAAFQAGLTTAQVDWVAIEKAQTITWRFPEWPSITRPLEQEMIGKCLADIFEI